MVSKVEIPLFGVISNDPLQQKLELSDLQRRNEDAAKELDDLLNTGWEVQTSAVYMIPPANQVLVVILHKRDTPAVEIIDADPVIGGGGIILHPVWDDNR